MLLESVLLDDDSIYKDDTGMKVRKGGRKDKIGQTSLILIQAIVLSLHIIDNDD